MTGQDKQFGETQQYEPSKVPKKLLEWAKQPGAHITPRQQLFIEKVHLYRDLGFGWMQQVIEWIWQEAGDGAWGPEYHQQIIARLTADPTPEVIEAATKAVRPALIYSNLAYTTADVEAIAAAAINAYRKAIGATA